MTSISQNTEHFEVQTFCVHCEESWKSIFAQVPNFSDCLRNNLLNDQVIPNVESVSDMDSFTIIPTGLSNERAWYLTICTKIYFTENVRKGCARRHMPEAADADNEIKLVCMTMMTQYKEKEEENM